jgi:hypothetical protein
MQSVKCLYSLKKYSWNQGGVIFPLFSDLYLNEMDKMLEKAKEITRNGKYLTMEGI